MQNDKYKSKINPEPDPMNEQISYSKYESDLKAYNAIEKLAAVDHDQWQFWSMQIMKDLDELIIALNDVDNRMIEANIGYANSPSHKRVINLIKKHNERNDRWQKQWVAYKNLPEEVKETDRVWAKKAYTTMKEGSK
jgi:hypothetical protein